MCLQVCVCALCVCVSLSVCECSYISICHRAILGIDAIRQTADVWCVLHYTL